MNSDAPASCLSSRTDVPGMYSAFRQLCETWLRIPPEPEAPPGDEATARVFRAAPKYLQYLLVIWGIRTAFSVLAASIPMVFLGFVLANSSNRDGSVAVAILSIEVVVLILLVLHSLFTLAVVHLDFEKRWYVVTDRSLRIREGVATVKEITFTFANIQNLSITQGPIQRMLGIADLKVETAGGGSMAARHPQQQQAALNLHTAFFRGINNADEVKHLIGERMRGHRDAGLGDHDDHAARVLTGIIGSPEVMDALEAVLKEATALRRTAEAA